MTLQLFQNDVMDYPIGDHSRITEIAAYARVTYDAPRLFNEFIIYIRVRALGTLEDMGDRGLMRILITRSDLISVPLYVIESPLMLG